MIKAIYLESYPKMDSVSAVEVLDELNPLIKNENNSTVLVGKNHKIYKDEFITRNYFVTFIKVINDLETLETMRKIYDIIQLGLPNFIKVLGVGNSLIIVTPKYQDLYENASYSVMIEELIRFTTYAYKKTGGDELTTSIWLKEYVEFCVSYPGNRSNSYKSENETGKN